MKKLWNYLMEDVVTSRLNYWLGEIICITLIIGWIAELFK